MKSALIYFTEIKNASKARQSRKTNQQLTSTKKNSIIFSLAFGWKWNGLSRCSTDTNTSNTNETRCPGFCDLLLTRPGNGEKRKKKAVHKKSWCCENDLLLASPRNGEKRSIKKSGFRQQVAPPVLTNGNGATFGKGKNSAAEKLCISAIPRKECCETTEFCQSPCTKKQSLAELSIPPTTSSKRFGVVKLEAPPEYCNQSVSEFLIKTEAGLRAQNLRNDIMIEAC
eukprot:g9523.t1